MAIGAELVRPLGGGRSRLLVVLAAVLAAEVLLGAAIASGRQQMAVAAVLAAAGAFVLWHAPFACACLFLALASGVFAGTPPGVSFAGRSIALYEVVLAGLVALAVIRPRRRTWGGPAGLALALFLGILALSSMLAVRTGAGPFNDILQWDRFYFLLSFFWVVVRLFPEREQLLRLLRWGAVIGAITGFFSFALALGLSPEPVFSDPTPAVIAPQGDLSRVRLPGLAVTFAMLWVIVLAVVRGTRPRSLWWLCLIGCALGLLVSFNRNMWVAASVGVVLLLLITGPKIRGRMGAAFAIVLAAVALLVVLPQTSGSVTAALDPVVERGETLLNPARVQRESSLQDRARENRVGWATAQDNLLLGVGPGVGWGMYLVDRSLTVPKSTPQLFLHNQYLFLLVISGVPGLVCFVAFMLSCIHAAFSAYRRQLELAMLGIALVGFMLTSIVMLSFSDPSYLAAIAFVTGAVVALRNAVTERETPL